MSAIDEDINAYAAHLDKSARERDINAEKLKRFGYLAYSIFKEGLGKEFMVYLDKMMIAPVAVPEKSPNHAYFREGENNIIRRIKAAMNMYINSNLQE